MNFRLFYRSPISGKLNFLFTTCVHCGKKVSLNRENIGQNRFGDKFYYCGDCSASKEPTESYYEPMSVLDNPCNTCQWIKRVEKTAPPCCFCLFNKVAKKAPKDFDYQKLKKKYGVKGY